MQLPLSIFPVNPPLEIATKKLKRGEILPIYDKNLWTIKSGAIKGEAINNTNDGVIVGYWGIGNIIGYPLCVPGVTCDLKAMSATSLEKVFTPDINKIFNRVHDAETFLLINSWRPLEMRLWHLLLFLSNKFGERHAKGIKICITITQQEMAATLNTTRVTVSRSFNQFIKTGVVYKEGRAIIITSEGIERFKQDRQL